MAVSADPFSMPSKDLALLRQIKTWPTVVPKMLEIIADTLHPFGFGDDPEKIRARLA